MRKIFVRKKDWKDSLAKAKVQKEISKKDGLSKTEKRNSWEQNYENYLSGLMAQGKIKRFYFNKIRFKVGENAWYKPDFIVILNDGSSEAHEVKGFERQAAIVRFKAAAMIYDHMTWIMVTIKNGIWVETRRIERRI